MFLAATNGHTEVAKLLVSAGAVHSERYQNESFGKRLHDVLYAAMKNKHLELAKYVAVEYRRWNFGKEEYSGKKKLICLAAYIGSEDLFKYIL